MNFTNFSFFVFFIVVFSLYWLVRARRWQNAILLIASYVFYGWLHPWYAIILGVSTLVDYGIALGIRQGRKKRSLLVLSLVLNLGMLAFFKYYDFFIGDIAALISGMGIQMDLVFVKIVLPLGLSFFTLKKISYVLDVFKGILEPSRDLVVFALYVAFFPQITAGPIDRPQKLIPQIETPRAWRWDLIASAWPLVVMGLFKKLVIANSVGSIVDRIFHTSEPTLLLAVSGALGFSLQILADFSAYTDLSRGIAYLLGFETSENFKSPYLSLTPTDFWNRWHITLSFWLRDYIFFPLRRALLRSREKVPSWLVLALPPLVTMLVSSLWHGVNWTYMIWGAMYGVLIVVYQVIGMGGSWKPSSKFKAFFAWVIMSCFIVLGWLIFAAPSLDWVARIFSNPLIGSRDYRIVSFLGLVMVFIYSLPLIIKMLLDRYIKRDSILHVLYFAVIAIITIVFINSITPDFIYFQF